MNRYTLLITSPDQKGLVYSATKVLYEHHLNIEKNDEFVDTENGKFFMRTQFSGEVDAIKLETEIREQFPKGSEVNLITKHKKRVVILATKESHCLGDILIKYDSGELDIEIDCVISNRDSLKPLVRKFELPFYCISHEQLNREEHEKKILQILNDRPFDYIILAKYMRILSPHFVSHYPNKMINIHHSFLPAFIGANPYKQAYERGVKIIGATAHFVNDNLDEGPIIEQDITHVDHSYSWQEMQKAGKEIEKVVLSRAMNLAIEDRIFVHGNKTIIF